MEEKIVLSIVNNFGANDIDEEDYKVYEEYFTNRDLSHSDDESSVEGDNTASQNNSLEDVSLLSNVPVVAEG